MRLAAGDPFPGSDATVADVLLAVHRSYLAIMKPLLSRVHAMAHITGGGIPGNLNRALPPTMDAVVDTGTWEPPNLFRQLETAGQVDRAEMFRAFNMGVGMIVLSPESAAEDVIASATANGVRAWRAGRTRRGSGQVILNPE
jgi:phosphoribosylformylglycinamidine cyclo-ligase